MVSTFQKRLRTASAKYQKSKRVSKSKSVSVSRNVGMLRSLGRKGFPDYTDVDMTYVENVQINPTAGVTGVYVFRCNSINDPNFTGIGHQPMGHDEMQAIYGKYRVLRASIRCDFSSPGSGAANQVIVGVRPSNVSTTTTDLTKNLEFKDTIYRFLTASPAQQTMFHSWNQDRLAKYIPEDALSADFGNNPGQDAYWQIFAGCPDIAGDPGTVNITVRIIYTVRCYDLKDLAQS